jgi:cystathionine beta-lyase
MHDFDFDSVIDRRNTASLKWEKYRGKDVYPLWVADMDFKSPPAVIDALMDRVGHGVFGYTLPSETLTDVICDRLFQNYRWRVSPEWIVWLPGLVTGLNLCCRAVGEVGDAVMTTVPVYPPFLSAPGLSGRQRIDVPMTMSGGCWTMDMDRINGAMTDRTSLFLLCSPYNPVGRVFSPGELASVAEICRRHDVIICSDEIHCDLLLDRDKVHTPLAALDPEIARRTITLMAPSKTYNMPGLGMSFGIVVDDGLRRRIRSVMDGIVPWVNALGFTAGLAAYQGGSAWLEALLDYLRGNRDLVSAEIAHTPGLATTHVEATYLAWIDCRGLGVPDPAAFFEAAGVGLSDGTDFGTPGFLRLNFGCSRDLLAKCLARMRKAALDYCP